MIWMSRVSGKNRKIIPGRVDDEIRHLSGPPMTERQLKREKADRNSQSYKKEDRRGSN